MIAFFMIAAAALPSQAQDSTSLRWYNSHFQWTTIVQEHFAFDAKYTGANSMHTEFEKRLSVTSTAYFGARLWKNAQGYIDMELGGGGGLSNALGIAGFPNGEVYRIGDPSPVIYPARMYLQQLIPLSQAICHHRWQVQLNGFFR
jgi:high affinity Mn2+ porin